MSGRRPRLLITAQVYPPEIHPTAVMVRQLALGLGGRDWDVTVAAGLPHHPSGFVAPGFGGVRLRVGEEDGVRVARCWHPTTPRRAIHARIAVTAAQSAAIAVAAAAAGKPDVVLAYGPPLVGPLLSGLLARTRDARLVTVIYDVYPDVAVRSGKVGPGPILSSARIVERWQYALSSRVVVLSEGLRRLLVEEKGVPNERVRVIPVWLDPGEIRPMPQVNPWRQEQGIPEQAFVVLYAGTAGVISGAQILLEVAERLQDDPGTLLLVVGGGEAWSELAREAPARGLTNLRLLPFQPRDRLGEMQACADVSVVTLDRGCGGTSVPSKVQGYMAAGRPVVASVDSDSDTARLVRQSGFGIVTPAGDVAALAEAIRDLRRDPARRAAMGAAARAAFDRGFGADEQIDRFDDCLRDALK